MKSLFIVLSFALTPLLSEIVEARGIACMSGDLRCGGGGIGGGGPRPVPEPVPVPVAAEPNRITAPQNPEVRCLSIPVPEAECEKKRLKALNAGCINQTEYKALVGYGSKPSCDYDMTPALLESWCPCGCFDQSVSIYVEEDGVMTWKKAGDIVNNWKSAILAALTPESNLSNPNFAGKHIRMATIGKEENQLYQIETSFGRGLKLTSEHPVLKSDGTMVPARSLKIGDDLVGIDGSLQNILSISRIDAEGDVVNFAVESEDKVAHIIAAEGVLVGDLVWQGSLSSEQAAIAVRQ